MATIRDRTLDVRRAVPVGREADSRGHTASPEHLPRPRPCRGAFRRPRSERNTNSTEDTQPRGQLRLATSGRVGTKRTDRTWRLPQFSSRPANADKPREASVHSPTHHPLSPGSPFMAYLRATDVPRPGARFPGRPELRRRRAQSAPVPGASKSPARLAGPRAPAPRLEAAEWLVGVTCRGGAGARLGACTSAGRGAAGRCRASAAGKVQRGAQR